jgi:isocitrate lyase
MRTKHTRTKPKQDRETKAWGDELRKIEKWFASSRFRYITRLHTAYDVVSLRGNIEEDPTIARRVAVKIYDYLRRLFGQKKQEITYGPFSPTGAVRAVMEGVRILYLGGWATSAKGSDSEDPGADLANYALDRVPKEGASWVRALLHQDRLQRLTRLRMTSAQRQRNPAIDFTPLIIPDGDTGHGGEHHIRNLVRKFVESGIGAVHIEDQRAGCKVCGHQGQKVLVSTAEMISRLNTARLQFDVMGVEGVIVARTDSNEATAIDSADDERDQPFVVGATNPNIPPFKNVILAVIRNFYKEGFTEINGHLLYRISENAYREADEWLDREGLSSLVQEGIAKIRNDLTSLEKLTQQPQCRKGKRTEVREELAALELTVKQVTEETVDHVLARIRHAWGEKAGLKTYADAVAEVMEVRARSGVQLPMAIDQWQTFAKNFSHGEAREKAESMGINIFWCWDLPKIPEGSYQITGGREMAVARGLAFAPFADLLWRETARPDLQDDRAWADTIHAVYPHMMLAYNLSPSWNWDAWGFTDDQLRKFADESGKMGYVYNFITYAGHQTEALMNGRLARALKEEGVLGFVRLIQRPLRLTNDPAQYPQTFVGGPWADRFRRAARGPSLTTASMGGQSTETQHRKPVEVPTTQLERWLHFWVQHWTEQGLYDKGELRAEHKERWAGSEEMMLNVFAEAGDKIAEITFRADRDREGRKFLAVKDQYTVQRFRSRRLMTLMHHFLLHRYKTDLVHYISPTDDNRASVQRMISYGVFREGRTDDPNVIVLAVNPFRVERIFASDESLKSFIASPSKRHQLACQKRSVVRG